MTCDRLLLAPFIAPLVATDSHASSTKNSVGILWHNNRDDNSLQQSREAGIIVIEKFDLAYQNTTKI